MKTKGFAKSVLGVAGLLLAGTFAPSVFAQNMQEQAPPTTQSAPGKHMHGEGEFANLGLSDDQKAQIKKIHMDAKAKADAVRADTSLSDADKQAKLKGIHRAAMIQARGVLTPDQRAQLKQEMQQRRAAKAQTPATTNPN